MATILNIETSTAVCSVALTSDGAVVWHDECCEGLRHAERLPLFVERALCCQRREGLPLEAVAVACGPGSYTGLRIGLATAKGLCYGGGVPLLLVPTLEVLCVPVLLRGSLLAEALLCPMIDARRMEVYAMVVDRALRVVRPLQAEVVGAESYASLLADHDVYFFGDGAAKCKDVLRQPHAHFLDDVVPLASNMLPLSERRWAARAVADVAASVPLYVKEAHVTRAAARL